MGGGIAALTVCTLLGDAGVIGRRHYAGPVAREVPIRGEMIRLGQLLKLAGIVGGGGEVKELLVHETVLVNGEPDNRRGRQLHPGDVVAVVGEELRLTSDS
jgi:ribosome-associated protein